MRSLLSSAHMVLFRVQKWVLHVPGPPWEGQPQLERYALLANMVTGATQPMVALTVSWVGHWDD